MDLMHARAEFEAGRLSEAAVEPSEQGDGWRLLLRTETGETRVLTDHSGRERLYHSLDEGGSQTQGGRKASDSRALGRAWPAESDSFGC